MPRLLLVLLAAASLTACDSEAPNDPVVFGGVEVTPTGDAALAIAGGTLVASGLDGTRAGGFTVGGALARLDVTTEPVTIPAGGRFGVVVEDAAGQPVASMFNEADVPGAAETGTLRVAFADGVRAVRVTYRLAGVVVFTIPVLDLTPSGGRLAQQGSAGTAEGKSGSVHVIRNGDGTYTVVSDAEGSAKRGPAARGDGPGGCLGFTVRPPVALPITFPDGTLCADWVEVTPLGGPATAAARASVVARGVGSFTVRSLAADF